MKYRLRNKIFTQITAVSGAVLLLFHNFLPVLALEKEDRIAANQAMEIQSNERRDWPTGPTVSAGSAILMELETGTILYEKNIHDHHYPASTTKILTTLIASEQSSLDEIVSFSHDAVFGIPRGSNHIAMDEGEALTMEECLNAILIRSANEVSYAVAEHIGKTWEGFADIMNERAKELGCVDSHFVNPNGLPDENHYTSAYDMAMIGRAFFSNDMLCKITTTSMLHIAPSERQPDDIVEWNKMELLPGRTYAYEYLVGCKTGYTDAARSALVSCAEKNGLKLICVVLRDESPYQYEDTISLFEYGFSNFDKINIAQTETRYNIESSGFPYGENDIFGNSKPLLSLNQQDCVIVPKNASFSDLTSEISYQTENESQAAMINYSYHNIPVGSASIDITASVETNHTFESAPESELTKAPEESVETPVEKPSFVFINVLKVLLWIVLIAVVILLLFVGIHIFRNYHISLFKSARRRWRHSRKSHKSQYRISNDIKSRRKAQIREAKRRYKKRRR